MPGIRVPFGGENTIPGPAAVCQLRLLAAFAFVISVTLQLQPFPTAYEQSLYALRLLGEIDSVGGTNGCVGVGVGACVGLGVGVGCGVCIDVGVDVGPGG